MANLNTRRSCVVPKCENTTTNAPGKLFFRVPVDARMRSKWMKAMKRSDPCGVKSKIYCCEDHFDLPNDMVNHMRYHVMGTVSKVLMKPGCIPTKFECQSEKPRNVFIEECDNDLDEKNITTKALESEGTSSGSMGKYMSDYFPYKVEFSQGMTDGVLPTKFDQECEDVKPTPAMQEVATGEAHITMVFDEMDTADRYINVKEETYASDEFQQGNNGNSSANSNVKIEDMNIMGQFNDENGSHDSGAYKVKIEYNNLDDNGSSENRNVRIENTVMLEQYLDENGVHDSGACIVKREYIDLEDNGSTDSHNVKMEDLDQFVDQDIVNGSRTYMVNIEFEDSDGSSEHIDAEESSISIEIEETDQDSKSEEHIDSRNNRSFRQLCGYSARWKCKIKRHTDSVRSNLKELKCKLCSYVTTEKRYLKFHIDDVHCRKKHQCHLCDYSTTLKSTLANHISNHSRVYKCQSDDNAAKLKSDIEKHIQSVRLNLKEYKCDTCEFATNQKEKLKNHIDFVHLNRDCYKCSLCNYAANHKNHVQRHINSVHFNLKPYNCDFCDYSSFRKWNLEVHMNCHHLNSKGIKCSLCDFRTNQKLGLKKHLDSVHLNSTKCK